MIIKATTQDRAEHISELCKSCPNHSQNSSVHIGVHDVTAQKCNSVHEGVHLLPQKCTWRCTHYYILIYITIVGL